MRGRIDQCAIGAGEMGPGVVSRTNGRRGCADCATTGWTADGEGQTGRVDQRQTSRGYKQKIKERKHE